MLGHILWLIAISLAVDTSTVNRWVLVVAGGSALLGVAAGLLGRRAYQRGSQVWTALLWCLPVSPVLFSIAVLGVTYL